MRYPTAGGRRPLPGALRLAASTLLAIVLALYAGELILMPKHNTPRAAAEQAGRHWDDRSILQMVSALRSSGADAEPAPQGRLGTPISFPGGQEVVTLGGVSDATQVLCNENGSYLVFSSDEHGFNNPRGLWSRPVETAVVGDSYVHGYCVPEGRGLVALLRQRQPATLNLGVAGDGPLSELATIREYLPTVKPRTVLWVYFENDLDDLSIERRSPILMRYLDDSSFSQRLVQRQPLIDSVLRADYAAPADEGPRTAGIMSNRFAQKAEQVAKLTYVRGLLASAGLKIGEPAGMWGDCCDLPLFERVISEAQRTVKQWGGQLVFVFLPARERFDHRPPVQIGRKELDARDSVLRIVRAHGIRVIDVAPAFAAAPDVTRLFYYPGSHYNEAGYRLAAGVIADSLAARN